MNMLTLCTIKYMNRSYFSKARYMIGVGFKILGRTPVPKLPQVSVIGSNAYLLCKVIKRKMPFSCLVFESK